MPDHVHLICTPYNPYVLATILRRVKGNSARQINLKRGESGAVWQREYFDRILRSDEDVREKAEYICNNPVRAGLVREISEYRWIWREWIEGQKAQAGLQALHSF